MTGHRKRPRDPSQLAKMIVDIAAGEVEDQDEKNSPASEIARKAGKKGGPARAAALDPKKRHEIAQKAADARWAKKR